jgi:hypothetical protein
MGFGLTVSTHPAALVIVPAIPGSAGVPPASGPEARSPWASVLAGTMTKAHPTNVQQHGLIIQGGVERGKTHQPPLFSLPIPGWLEKRKRAILKIGEELPCSGIGRLRMEQATDT